MVAGVVTAVILIGTFIPAVLHDIHAKIHHVRNQPTAP
jgi:hypothetical protein